MKFYLIISASVILLHQLTQKWVYNLIETNGGSIKVLPFFNLVEVWNKGISFGMFNQLIYGKWLLSVLAITIILILLYLLWKASNRLTAIALCLIIGGAVGNTIDRIRFGAVADYLDFHASGYHWPAFNVTDIAIFTGAILMVFFQSKNK